LAYAALAINEEYKYFKVNKCTFSKFIQNSDDEFSACLLKDILINEKNKFDEILSNDFDLPLFAYNIKDAFFDTYPSENEFKKDLNKNNSIYRISIGQQKPYQFKDVVQWYARMASNKKIYLNASEKFSDMSLSNNTYQFFRKSMNSVLYGTANDVGINLSGSGINLEQFIAKTGTAEHTSGKYNNSSSFIIANSSYTIAIMLNGKLPYNDKNLSAKVLFIKLIPTLLKYNILERN
jgi:cell division protein FtsI/penicillin-binding protein 2